MNDPFGEIDARMIERETIRAKRDAFLRLLDKHPKTEADLTALREAKKDPFLNAIFLFRDYYDLKKKEGSLTDIQRAQLATMESKYGNIVRVYNDAKLKAMMIGKGRRRRTQKRTSSRRTRRR
jgi:hypothetical protein